MDWRYERKLAFTAYGISRHFTYETCRERISVFWKETMELQKKPGISYHNDEEGFDYLIGDLYAPWKKVSEECQTVSYAEGYWLVFSCTGKIPDALKAMNAEIFSKWIPQHEMEYRLWKKRCIELYTPGDPETGKMYTEIWNPAEQTG